MTRILLVCLVALSLGACSTQLENNSTGGGAFKQGNGEQNALGADNGNPGQYPGSDNGGVANGGEPQ